MIDGALVVYGGNPNGADGQARSGDINVHANNISLYYDPSTLGNFSNLFGGTISVQRVMTATF